MARSAVYRPAVYVLMSMIDVETMWDGYAAGAGEASGSIDLEDYVGLVLEVESNGVTDLDVEGSADDATFRWNLTEPFVVAIPYERFIGVDRLPRYVRVVTSQAVTLTVKAHKMRMYWG